MAPPFYLPFLFSSSSLAIRSRAPLVSNVMFHKPKALMLTDQFRKAKSRTIQFEGKTVVLYEQLSIPQSGIIRLDFLNAESEWRQGVWIGDMPSKRGLQLTVAGQSASSMRIWKDSSPNSIEIAYQAPEGSISFYNIWDTGNSQATSQLNGAGMAVTTATGVHVYNCNDGHPDTTFSHLMFSVEIRET